MTQKQAFTLVELIVGVMISMILMVGIGVLVSGGINNLVLQEKVMKNTSHFIDFSKDLNELFFRIDTNFKPKDTITWTSTLVKVKQNYDKIWVSYIWEIEKDWVYCSWTDIDSTITKHILIKNFLPFEEVWEDIFDNFSWTLYSKVDNFKAFYKSHVIKEGTDIIIWKSWIFWDKLWEYWTWTYLNNPTGLAYDSGKKLLYIADTGNNRILVYNNDSTSPDYKKIYKLLWEKEWLNEPMGLAFYDWVLYITNSWNWEILEYSSKEILNNPNLILTWITQSSINKFEIEFLSGNIELSSPNSINDFSFTPNRKNTDDFVKINDSNKNKLKYYFISSLQSESHQSDCTAWNQWKYVVNSSDVPIKCSSTEIWTWRLANLKTTSFSDQEIEISNINPNFSDKKNYYIKINLILDNTIKNELYYPYFTNWDKNLFTRDNNVLKVISNAFKYPTWISYDTTNNKLKINDFWDRKQYSINLDWTWKSQTKTLTYFDYTKILEDKKRDYFLTTPIDKLKLNYSNFKKYLSLELTYFKQYNCYNLDQKIKRNIVLGKSFNNSN